MASPQPRIYLETIEHFQLRSLLVLVTGVLARIPLFLKKNGLPTPAEDLRSCG